jgi:hypothetical protein
MPCIPLDRITLKGVGRTVGEQGARAGAIDNTSNAQVEPDCGDCAPCLPDEFQFYLTFHRTVLTRLSAKTVTVSAPNTYIRGLFVRSSIPHRHRHRLRLSSSIFSSDVARSASVVTAAVRRQPGVSVLKMLEESMSGLD